MYPTVEKLSELLVSQSYISEKESKLAESNSTSSEEYVQYLVSNELISKIILGEAIAEFLKIKFIDLSTASVTPEQLEIIDEQFARKYRVVYVEQRDKSVIVASDDPHKIDIKLLQNLFPEHKVSIAYTLPDYIEARFEFYDKPLPTRFAEIIEKGSSIAPELVDEIIKDALKYKASDIHFEPDPDEVSIRFRVDGLLRKAGTLPKTYYENVLNRIKVESGMRIDEHFIAQDGAIQHHLPEGTVDLRVSLVPTVNGEKTVMRVLGSYIQNYSLSDVGLSEAQQATIVEYANRPFGMILTVGPTGSGKTTTLYALLKLLNKPDLNITTIEDPVEYRMAGANQIQVQEASGITFSRGLRAIVRQDPDIILVGEIRDKETAEIAVNAALTGHLLMSTFHANDAATAVPRLIDMGIEPFLLASTLELVVAQRLVRKLCTMCRYRITHAEAVQGLPNASLTAKYFRKDDSFYAAKGCNNCNNSGYKGRLGLFEFLEITPAMQELIVSSPSSQDIEKLAVAEKGHTMFTDAVEKVRSGQTSLQEALRVVMPPATKK